MSYFIVKRCASWAQRNDGLVEILTTSGEIIYLNYFLSYIWFNMDDKIQYDVLKERVISICDNNELDVILDSMNKKKIIEYQNDDTILNSMFL